MKYRFKQLNNDLIDSFLSLNNLKKEDLNYLDYEKEKKPEAFIKFAEKFKELKDDKILIIGDYDCDGICATTIITDLCNKLGYSSNYYIPSRYDEGYGLNKEIINKALANSFTCILCLDNGISAIEEINYCKENNLKLLIIDHHEYSSLPEIDALLHPDLLPEDYYDACTAGLCYGLYTCFLNSDKMLAYAGLATMADVVKVFNYNRYLIVEGLKRINDNMAPALTALLEKIPADYSDLSFSLAPKINAVSRIKGNNVNIMVKYLLQEDSLIIKKTAKSINLNNQNRRKISQDMLKKVNDEIVSSSIIYLADESFQEGMCGILAGRLANQYGKPALVLAKNKECLNGSGRSIETDLYQLIKAYPGSLLKFGGHALALGISLDLKEEESFVTYLNSLNIQQAYKDAYLLEEEMINIDSLNQLKSLEPFGQGLNKPIFALNVPKNYSYKLIQDKYHKFICNGFTAMCFDPKVYKEDAQYWIGTLLKDKYNNTAYFRIEDMQ